MSFIKEKFRPFFDTLNGLAVEPATRTRILECTVATAIGRSLPVPSNPVDDPSDYFYSTVAMGVSKIISEVNELALIDVRRVNEEVKSHWMVRYHALHDVAIPNGAVVYDFFCGMFRVGMYFTKDDYDFMAVHANAIYRCVNVFKECFIAAE